MSYLVLVDHPEDPPGVIWIEADDEGQARDRAAEFCSGENGQMPFRPVGHASLVQVVVPYDVDSEHDQQDPRVGQRVELWKVVVL